MWNIRDEELSLEESEGGLVLKGGSGSLKDALDLERADIFEIEFNDDELHRLADALDEYFASHRL